MPPTFYWYDYETFGTDPARDRPAQFAGLRTDEDLTPVGRPLVLYCRPANDFLPQPEACLITGITPQQALEKGVCEAEFIAQINAEFSQPETCVSGYNTIRFDDEVTRYTLYRNLMDPYAREWRNGNSRWDLIDVMRLTYALRPEGIVWPERDDGAPSFKLEHLTVANGIEHHGAHDALADVEATIALARLLKDRQPKLYEFCFRHRRKSEAWKWLDLKDMRPVLHVSEKYPAKQGCLAVVAPLALDPNNPNGVFVYDLAVDPAQFHHLSVDDLRERLFTRREDLPEGMERLPVKTVRVNRCPVLAPLEVLRKQDQQRLGIELAQCLRHLEALKKHRGFWEGALTELSQSREMETLSDPDLMLYSGGFFSDADRARMARIRALPPERLGRLALEFDDPRLPEMVFRYRARNYPDTLNPEEQNRWQHFRRQRLLDPSGGASIVWDEFWARLQSLRRDSETIQTHKAILKALEDYARMLLPDIHPLPSD